VPFAVIFVTRNFFWFLLAPGLVLLSRSISSSDHNKARVKWLGFLAGSKNPLSRIRARKVWGGQSVDPLGSIR
jgi:type IV secretory pathway VirB3-like protein